MSRYIFIFCYNVTMCLKISVTSFITFCCISVLELGQSIEAAAYSKYDNGEPDSPDVSLCEGMFRNDGSDDIDYQNRAPIISEKSLDSMSNKQRGPNEYRYDYNQALDINGWIKIHIIPAKWKDARLRCQFEGAVLASPETPGLASTLKSIAAESFPCGMYTGVHASFSQGDYFSVEGTPIGRMPIEWAPDEPDNHEGNEDCIILQSNATAADVKCTDMYPYVCYKRGPVTLNECGSVDPGYIYERRTGTCYKFHYVGRNWTRAFMACAGEGAHLAVVNSNVEASVLSDIFSRHPASNITGVIKDIAHIGFQNWGEIRTWTTIHGQSLQEAGYSTFNPNQPDYFEKKIVCGGIFRSGGLDDFPCEEQAPFICEKYPDSLL